MHFEHLETEVRLRYLAANVGVARETAGSVLVLGGDPRSVLGLLLNLSLVGALGRSED